MTSNKAPSDMRKRYFFHWYVARRPSSDETNSTRRSGGIGFCLVAIQRWYRWYHIGVVLGLQQRHQQHAPTLPVPTDGDEPPTVGTITLLVHLMDATADRLTDLVVDAHLHGDMPNLPCRERVGDGGD